MSDWIADTPAVTRPWCPDCQPDVDETRELVHVDRCIQHPPPERDGVDDIHARVGGFLSGTAEGGGEDNRRFCDFIHRRSGAQ